ncbi:hypothetical protein B0H14DRAFT_2950949 [Mycena olivaceomarginata]|nr:hypothetical protein B0H14DRAFT_2950949 [Mycena olivaceomarginata]
MLSTVQRPFILLILQCAFAAASRIDTAFQYPGISHLPTAATTPSLLSPLLIAQNRRTTQAITLAAFLLLSAFICGLAWGSQSAPEANWRTPRNTGVPPPHPLFSPDRPSYIDDCGANLMAQDDLAVGSRFDSGGRRYSV